MTIPPTIGAAGCAASLRAVPVPPHDRQQAGQDDGHRHRLGPHAQHGAFTNGIQQIDLAGLALVDTLMPGVPEVAA